MCPVKEGTVPQLRSPVERSSPRGAGRPPGPPRYMADLCSFCVSFSLCAAGAMAAPVSVSGATRPPGGCHTDEFQCRLDGLCIPMRWRCDGDTDCMDSSDEKNCEGSLVCKPPSHTCANNTSICLPPEKLCDGSDDCGDGSDEGELCGECGCSLNNGGCSHNCTVAPGEGIVCSCPLGMELGSDNKTCQIQSYCPFIIFSNRHEIRRIDLHRGDYSVLVPGLRNTIALDFHLNQSSLYWTDVVEDKIYRGKLDPVLFEVVIQYGLATPEGLAVDWIAGNIYWVESNLDQIEVAKLDGTMRTTLGPRSLGHGGTPGIVRGLGHGLLSGHAPQHWETELGVSVPTVPTGSGGWPNGLTVDYLEKRILWIDARWDQDTHLSLYDGTGHIEVLRGHEYLSHPFAVTLYGGEVYWTDWRTNTLAKANKWTGHNVTVVQRTNTQPFDLQVYHPSRQPLAPNPCEANGGKGPCSHLCLINYNRTLSCACPHLMKLDKDNTTCYGRDLPGLPRRGGTNGASELVPQTRLGSHNCPSHPPPQSLRSSCCTHGRWRSGAWTSTTPTTTTSSPSRCPTLTTSRWWTMMPWSSAFTGLMSAPRPSREPSSTAPVWRPSSLQVGVGGAAPCTAAPSGPTSLPEASAPWDWPFLSS
uniref:EGF-like domain-containing protein n=1 Tax=Strix occidentalis caurina TaxID=311401 RepID=A0A8D0KZI1_STROC